MKYSYLKKILNTFGTVRYVILYLKFEIRYGER